MVRTRAAPAPRRTRARPCRCPEYSNRWAGLEFYDRVKATVGGVKDTVAEVRQAVLPDAEMKAAKDLNRQRVESDRERRVKLTYAFASATRTREDPRVKGRFYIDSDKYVDVNVLDPTSVANAKKTIDIYRQRIQTGAKPQEGDPKPKSKHEEELERLERERDILQTKVSIKSYKDKLRGKTDEYGRSYSSPGKSKPDILKPGFFAGAVDDGKNTTKVYNYKKVSETAGALVGDFNYRRAPPARRQTPCTCRRRP